MPAPAPAKSQAPMVSITHFMDRDGQFLASVSPRRFFCTAVPRAADMRRSRRSAMTSSTSTPCSAAQRRVDGDERGGSARRRGRLRWHVPGISSSSCGTCCARPSSVFGLGVLVLAGFVAGVIFWGGFNTALELTNTEKFCTGCHEMRDNVFVGAEAHHPFHQPLRRARELPGLPRAAQLDRQDRAQDAGLEGSLGPAVRHHRYAREVRRRTGSSWRCTNGRGFKANDSLECRNCHSAESMDITKQSPRASVAHQRFLFTGEKQAHGNLRVSVSDRRADAGLGGRDRRQLRARRWVYQMVAGPPGPPPR